MTPLPIVLVPGFWLGAWAWDEVAAALRADGHDVTALTLPGLESADADRSTITFADHVDAICDGGRAAGRPSCSPCTAAPGSPGYAASDRVPERIAAMVYVDTGPGKGALDPDFEGVEMPLPSPEELAANENLDGLSEEQLETFRQRAVPEPGGVLRERGRADKRRAPATSRARSSAPGSRRSSTRRHVEEGYAFLAGLTELRDVTWVDLPTSHWPMWSRPQELAEIIAGIARSASAD